MPIDQTPLNAWFFRTELGWMTILGRDDVLTEVHFGAITRHDAERRVREELTEEIKLADWNPELAVRLRTYAETGHGDFLDVKIDTKGRTDFKRQVLDTCRRIAPGSTMTYGELAEKVGFAGAARAVGSVMARNRIPIVIPCHRVVGSDGRLTGFSAPGGCDTKRKMLELEAARIQSPRQPKEVCV